MTISLSQQSGTTEKLDATTELCIGALRDTAADYQHAKDHGKIVRWSEVTYAENVLRSRIRKLIEEARANAVVDYLKDKDFVIGDMSGIEGHAP